MNMIFEKRETIIQENNTAQTQLLGILEDLYKNLSELWINQIFHGDLDFSVIRELGFSDIKKIFLIKGEITSIRGLPQDIRELKCQDNYLTEFNDLPHSLVELNLSFNYIQHMDMKKVPSLKKVNLSNNQLMTIENLPTSLEELYLNNNQIKEIDLQHLLKLRVLHVKNNKSIVLKNIPKSLIDLQMDNDPFRAEEAEAEDEEGEGEEESNTIEYREALHEYFKIKQKYEEKNLESKRNAYRRGTTKKEKKRLVLEVKPQCIHCNRPVGTLFSLKNNKYTAICGDPREPCSLNVKIFKGETMNFEDVLYLYKEEIDKLKDDIIRQKLDTLFNYLNERESIEQFKKNLAEYNFESAKYTELVDKYNEYYKNPILKTQVAQKTEDIYQLIGAIRKLLEEYEKTKNKEVLKRIIEIENQELIPETHNLRMLKYKIMEVYTEKGANILFQKSIGLGDYDYSVDEKPRVIKFRT